MSKTPITSLILGEKANNDEEEVKSETSADWHADLGKEEV
jgi:hypothetical protein